MDHCAAYCKRDDHAPCQLPPSLPPGIFEHPELFDNYDIDDADFDPNDSVLDYDHLDGLGLSKEEMEKWRKQAAGGYGFGGGPPYGKDQKDDNGFFFPLVIIGCLGCWIYQTSKHAPRPRSMRVAQGDGESEGSTLMGYIRSGKDRLMSSGSDAYDRRAQSGRGSLASGDYSSRRNDNYDEDGML